MALMKLNCYFEEKIMELNLDLEKAREGAVTILRPHGRIDGSNYLQLVDAVRKLYQGGARKLLLDFGDVNFLSSAGLVGLHQIVLIMRGEQLSSDQTGWDALATIDRDSTGRQTNVKLLNLQPKVSSTLEMAAMDRFFEIFSDEAAAIASF
jgi:anti-anti-sigma factor